MLAQLAHASLIPPSLWHSVHNRALFQVLRRLFHLAHVVVSTLLRGVIVLFVLSAFRLMHALLGALASSRALFGICHILPHPSCRERWSLFLPPKAYFASVRALSLSWPQRSSRDPMCGGACRATLPYPFFRQAFVRTWLPG